MAAIAAKTRTDDLTVDRKVLLAALQRSAAVIPSRTPKPIFAAVRLSTENEWLHIAATDGAIQLAIRVEAHGRLPVIVVNCQDLLARVKSGRQPECVLAMKAKPARLIINGGAVEHTLPALDPSDFPPTPEVPVGKTIQLDAALVRTALSVTSAAMAADATRYAMNGLLLESDAQGARLVGTDARRLALCELNQGKIAWQGKVILSARFAKLAEQLAGGADSLSWSFVDKADAKGAALPAQIHVAGEDWTLATYSMEGSFPNYRDVFPVSGSRFTIDRKPLIDALKQVALATNREARAVQLVLGPRRVEVMAQSAEGGASSAKLPCRFLGGGDNAIKTGFNPQYLLDALQTLPGETAVFDLQQNGLADAGVVFGKPCVLTPDDNAEMRWVIMPVSIGLAPTRENLGSNYREPSADAA